MENTHDQQHFFVDYQRLTDKNAAVIGDTWDMIDDNLDCNVWTLLIHPP